MTHLKAVFTFEVPLNELTLIEQNAWRRAFAELQQEILQSYRARIATTLVVKEVER